MESGKVRTIRHESDIDPLEEAVIRSARAAATWLRESLDTLSPVAILRRIKFEPVGFDPLSDRPLNLIEQVNQTFTYLATFEALRHLFRRHPGAAPLVVNLGTASGRDIWSEDGSVAAEVFASVSPKNNRKLQKDLATLASVAATYRYVFYSCPGSQTGEVAVAGTAAGITVISLGVCGPT
jgi:hypothetical protein